MTIIDIHKPPKTFNEHLELAFDLDAGELWVASDCLPRDCVCKAGLTTIAMLRRHNKLYLPLDWCINEWDGPKDLIDSMKDRRQLEFAMLDEYKDRYQPMEVFNVGICESQIDGELQSCDEHPRGQEGVSFCSSGEGRTCDGVCK